MESMERELRDIFQQAAEGAAESIPSPEKPEESAKPEEPDYAGLLRRIQALEARLIQPEPEEQEKPEEPEVQEPPKKPIPQNLPRFAAPIQGKAPEREEEIVARRYKNNPWYKRFGA